MNTSFNLKSDLKGKNQLYSDPYSLGMAYSNYTIRMLWKTFEQTPPSSTCPILYPDMFELNLPKLNPVVPISSC